MGSEFRQSVPDHCGGRQQQCGKLQDPSTTAAVVTGTDAAEATAACKALCTAASFCKGIAAKETVNSNAAGVLLMEGASKAGEGSLATVAVGCGTGAIAIAAGAAMGNCEGNSVDGTAASGA